MWNNNGFHGHGNFQQGPGNYQQNFLDDGYIPFSPVTPGQQYFPQRLSQAIDYNSPLEGSQQSTPGEFRPEIGLYNDGSFLQNQFLGFEGPEQFVSQQQATAPRPALNARAEELRAQLLRSKERARSGTPPITTTNSAPNPSKSTEAANSFRNSPKTPASSSDGPSNLSRRPSGVMDEDINDLISEAQAAAKVKKEGSDNEASATKPHQYSKEESRIKSQLPSTEPSTKSIQSDVETSQAKPAMKGVNRSESKAELSDASEGEIWEDVKKMKPQLPADTKEPQKSARNNKENEPISRKPRNEGIGEVSQTNEAREVSVRRENPTATTRARPSRPHDERREEEQDERPERKAYQADNKYERRHHPEKEQKPYHHQQQPRDATDDYKPESGKLQTSSLAKLLLINEDLKDWLDVTGYHNIEYRNKILNRRRAIAALDAQKAKLLEEMEIEERGGITSNMNAQTTAVGMLPPFIPNKLGAVAASVKKAEELPIHKSTELTSSAKADQESGFKRSYTEYRESRNEEVGDKLGHVDQRGRGIKSKNENDVEARIPSSHAYDSFRARSLSPHRRSPSRRRSASPRRPSPPPDSRVLRHDDRDSSRKSLTRDTGRPSSRRLESSPSYEPPESKRAKTYDFNPTDAYQDREDYSRKGQYVEIGRYRGRAYDPNYSSRGRGRGRGGWKAPSESQFEQRPIKQEPVDYRISSMKPYRDSKPLNLGGRGG